MKVTVLLKVKEKLMIIDSQPLQNRCHASLFTLGLNEEKANAEKVCRQKDVNRARKFQGGRS